MKKTMFSWLLALTLMPFINAGCQNDSKNAATTAAASINNSDIKVPESLLHFAEQMGFKYNEVLEKCKKGDRKAIQELLRFHGTADGVDGLNHAVVCLEIIPIAGDEMYASALKYEKPKLKTLLLERLNLAQGRTTNESLRAALSTWAPMTWAALNNLPIPGECDMKSEEMQKPGMQKPGQAPAATDSPQPGAAILPGDSPRGKQ